MALDFVGRRISFDFDKGEPQTKVERFEFPSSVRKAQSLINGFSAQYRDENRPYFQLEVNTSTAIDEEDVTVTAKLALRDSSGTFDDPFGGFIDVVLIVDRV